LLTFFDDAHGENGRAQAAHSGAPERNRNGYDARPKSHDRSQPPDAHIAATTPPAPWWVPLPSTCMHTTHNAILKGARGSGTCCVRSSLWRTLGCAPGCPTPSAPPTARADPPPQAELHQVLSPVVLTMTMGRQARDPGQSQEVVAVRDESDTPAHPRIPSPKRLHGYHSSSDSDNPDPQPHVPSTCTTLAVDTDDMGMPPEIQRATARSNMARQAPCYTCFLKCVLELINVLWAYLP
jgi:hypothetical protein